MWRYRCRDLRLGLRSLPLAALAFCRLLPLVMRCTMGQASIRFMSAAFESGLSHLGIATGAISKLFPPSQDGL